MTEKINYTIIASIETLSLRPIDYGNVIILPVLILFSMLTNILSLVVLFQTALKKIIFKHMLLMCFFDFYTLLSAFWLCLIRCGALCSHNISYSYGSKFYELYFYLYLTNVSIFLSNIMDLLIALNRLFSFSLTKHPTEKLCKIPLKWEILAWIVASFIFAIPNYILTREVSQIGYLNVNNGTHSMYEPLYQVQTNKLGSVKLVKLLLFFIALLRKPFPLFVLCLVNLLMGVRFKKYVNEKRKIVPIHNSKPSMHFKITRVKI